jgi:IclR family transcriptional regulator, acetate operon repressor
MNGASPGGSVKTTVRSLEIIDLVQKRDGCSLMRLVGELGLAKSTVYKHLCTLEDHGYLVKENGIYHIGLKFHHRGEYARLRKRGYRLAGRTVHELAERTNEEVDFVVENDGRVITIHESYHPSHTYHDDHGFSVEDLSQTGTYYRMHYTAAGKALLSEFEADRVEAVIEQWGLPRRTERTITTRSELYDELERVRERGYAIADEEYAAGLRAIGVAVENPDGSLLGGLSMSVPTYRRESETFEKEASQLIKEAATGLEDELARDETAD